MPFIRQNDLFLITVSESTKKRIKPTTPRLLPRGFFWYERVKEYVVARKNTLYKNSKKLLTFLKNGV